MYVRTFDGLCRLAELAIQGGDKPLLLNIIYVMRLELDINRIKDVNKVVYFERIAEVMKW